MEPFEPNLISNVVLGQGHFSCFLVYGIGGLIPCFYHVLYLFSAASLSVLIILDGARLGIYPSRI